MPAALARAQNRLGARLYSTSNTDFSGRQERPERGALGVLKALLVEREVEIRLERSNLPEVVFERDR